MKTLITIFFIFVFFLSFFSAYAQSQESSYVARNKESLADISQVKLVVNYIIPGTESLLPKSTVYALAEKRLKSRGLIVLKEPYPPKSSEIPTIHIVYSLLTSGEDDEYLKFAVSIEVSQEAILVRDNEIQSPVITWQMGFHGIGTAFNLNPVNKEMLNYLDLFIEDWESVNKKKATPQNTNKNRKRIVN